VPEDHRRGVVLEVAEVEARGEGAVIVGAVLIGRLASSFSVVAGGRATLDTTTGRPAFRRASVVGAGLQPARTTTDPLGAVVVVVVVRASRDTSCTA
jgi:hypothetical protein